MSQLVVYGIGSCDSCRKARKWLDQQGRNYRWHDLRADRVDPERLTRWLAQVGVETLLNRRSTTWRSLAEKDRAKVGDLPAAAELLQNFPTLIKRPVFERDGDLMVGFNASVRESL